MLQEIDGDVKAHLPVAAILRRAPVSRHLGESLLELSGGFRISLEPDDFRSNREAIRSKV
jgi:hypothetical protein